MVEGYIDFATIKSYIKLDDKNIFLVYLKDIYKDLTSRSEENKKLGISKVTFYDYVKLPVFIAEKLFTAMDKDNDSYLNFNEFSEGLSNLYFGDFDELIRFIFNVYDFDKDGKITFGDAKVLLSYLPLKKLKLEYSLQMQSLGEIDEILKATFGKNNSIDLNEFQEIIEKKISDVFLQLLCFLYEKKPFSEENVNLFKKLKSPKSPQNYQRSPTIIKSIPSPSRKTLFSPADNLIKKTSLVSSEFNKDEFQKLILEEEFGIQMVRMNNKIVAENNPKHSDQKVMNSPTKKVHSPELENIIKKGVNTFDSPTHFLKKEPQLDTEWKLEDNLIKIDNNEQVKKDIVEFSGNVYKVTQNNKIKCYFLCLQGNDIYYYKNETKEDYEGMHNLTSCFIKENGEVSIDKNKFYSFSIIFSAKTRNYFVKEKEEMKKWVKHLKQGIGYNSFFDHYEMMTDIGEGKFGVVKLGVHKKTKEKVAIKIIKKESMNQVDMELVHTEIDIMKLCHHQNVVKLLDHFENSDYIFIVMEYLSGGDLGNFLHKKKFKIGEELAGKILYQIALGLEYLHQYGILHRDLKPDNIMLANKDEKNPVLKIMDFGLSKILGPKETAADGFGTLTFVAPEVLVRQPYNKQIDIWSLGVILYYILSGTLPFDDENDNEEKIAKMTVFVDVSFPENKWKNISPIAIDLIKKCLIKDPEKRIKIETFLKHDWIKKQNQI